MTNELQGNEGQDHDNKPSDKELNFRALDQKYQKQIDQLRQENERKDQEYQRKIQELMQRNQEPEDDDDDEPYIDKRKFSKTLTDFERKMEEKFDKRVNENAQKLLAKRDQEQYVKNNPDFFDTLQKYSEEFANRDPELAETILKMPEGFERQKLVYKNIKALGLDKPKEDPIQDKVNNNRRGMFYSPTGIAQGTPVTGGDFSKAGKEQAYNKMQELKARLRIR